ncbi:pheromone precursor protein 1 [Ophiocordyceps camponoti-floridani]|uniref:Pheromone protein 1 n=1 Tax=Ophiocordyceps camponoti-floridani TaxID=2030778 RepID=A0A8H4QC97_9HYPO|nr:pheromone precursor protein 1 [Ophiocordyceps camponoti-floridani]
MKFNAIVAIALVTGVSAAPQPWCKRPNSICPKVKRAADAVAEVAAQGATAELTHLLTLSEEQPDQYSSEALGIALDKREPEPWCTRPNSQCGPKKRSVEKREPEPWCYRPNSQCGPKKRSVEKREPEPWCTRPNSICSKVKRAADAVVEVAALDATEELGQLLENNVQHSEALGFSDKTMDKRWCYRPNSQCGPKRSVDKREPEPWCTRPNSICSKVKRSPWCTRPNSICSKVKRSLEKREPEPEPWCTRPNSQCGPKMAKREPTPWCTRPNSICSKVKRAIVERSPVPWCTRPNSICSKVKRSLAKREPEPWCTRPNSQCGPKMAKREPEPWCTRPNSICSKVKRAADVFADTVQQSVKQDSAAPRTASEAAAHDAVVELAQLLAQTGESPEEYIKSLGLNDSEDNKTVAKRDVEGTSETEAEEKEACLAEGGACWAAKRAVDAVLETVNAEQDDAEEEAECSQRGEACWHQKRQLGALRFAANDISSSLL